MCKHCKEKGTCYTHCQETEDGKHVPDPNSIAQSDGQPFILDVWCKKCGTSGSIVVMPGEIQWD